MHAYWAPNVYAFYCLTDLALGALGRRLAVLPSRAPGKASWASGLVQVVKPEVLPSITPLMTALLTLGSMAPALWRLWTPAAKGGQDGAVKRWVKLRWKGKGEGECRRGWLLWKTWNKSVTSPLTHNP